MPTIRSYCNFIDYFLDVGYNFLISMSEFNKMEKDIIFIGLENPTNNIVSSVFNVSADVTPPPTHIWFEAKEKEYKKIIYVPVRVICAPLIKNYLGKISENTQLVLTFNEDQDVHLESLLKDLDINSQNILIVIQLDKESEQKFREKYNDYDILFVRKNDVSKKIDVSELKDKLFNQPKIAQSLKINDQNSNNQRLNINEGVEAKDALHVAPDDLPQEILQPIVPYKPRLSFSFLLKQFASPVVGGMAYFGFLVGVCAIAAAFAPLTFPISLSLITAGSVLAILSLGLFAANQIVDHVVNPRYVLK